jgi:hypothetical protein
MDGLVALPELPISTGSGGLQAGMDTMVKSIFLFRQETYACHPVTMLTYTSRLILMPILVNATSREN